MEELASELIVESEAFQARIQHDSYRLGMDKIERACQMIWELDRGALALRKCTGWVNAWPGYSGGTLQWVRDSITDRRLVYILSPNLNRWVSSYKVWDSLSSDERALMHAWILLRDSAEIGMTPNRLRQRRLDIVNQPAYQYTNVLSGELSIPHNYKVDFTVDELLSPLPEFVQEGLSVQDISNNPNLVPQND